MAIYNYGIAATGINLVNNGSFENALAGWTLAGTTTAQMGTTTDLNYVYRDSTAIYANASAATDGYLKQDITFNNGNKYYVRCMCMPKSYTSGSKKFADFGGALNCSLEFDSTKLNQWQSISNVFTCVTANNRNEIRVGHIYAEAATWTAYFDSFMVVNLTNAFSWGYEPTKEWCDANIPFFNGSAKLPNVYAINNLTPNGHFNTITGWVTNANVSLITNASVYGTACALIPNTANFETSISSENINYIQGHKYYVTCMVNSDVAGRTGDIYFPLATPYPCKQVTCTNAGIWYRNSFISADATIPSGSYPVRLDNNHGTGNTGTMYFTRVMIVDLTASFGAGNEPTVTWCDANLYYATPGSYLPRNITIKTGDKINIPFTGNVQTVKLPVGIYKIECWGAEGGNRGSALGGYGGYSTGTINITQAQNFYCYVGGGPTSGFNGGKPHPQNAALFSGGGTDVRFQDRFGYFDRIIVAGGGGTCGAAGYGGGAGGGLDGIAANGGLGTGGLGGTQTAGGANNGVFGEGGTGVYASAGYGGSGGGGWFGGGGVQPDSSADDDKGGGGGSSYILTTTSARPTGYAPPAIYNMDNSATIAGNATMTIINGVESTGNPGNGAIRITAIRTTVDKPDAIKLPYTFSAPNFFGFTSLYSWYVQWYQYPTNTSKITSDLTIQINTMQQSSTTVTLAGTINLVDKITRQGDANYTAPTFTYTSTPTIALYNDSTKETKVIYNTAVSLQVAAMGDGTAITQPLVHSAPFSIAIPKEWFKKLAQPEWRIVVTSNILIVDTAATKTETYTEYFIGPNLIDLCIKMNGNLYWIQDMAVKKSGALVKPIDFGGKPV